MRLEPIMSPNKECPKQFVTVSNILGIICAIGFLASVVLVSTFRPMVVSWFYDLPQSVSIQVLAAIFFGAIYLTVVLNKPIIWVTFGIIWMLAIAGWAYNFRFWEGRLILLIVYGVLFYMIYILRKCSVWVAFIFMALVGIDLFYSIYCTAFRNEGIPLASLIIDPICLFLLIKGYWEYRKNSHVEVPPADDIIAVSKK